MALAVLAALWLLSALAFASVLGWPWELACHFRAHYAILFVILSGVFAWQRRWPAMAIALAGYAVNAAFVVSLYALPPADGLPSTGRRYRAVMLNVLADNGRYDGSIHYLAASDADILAVIEPHSRWMLELAALRASYPFVEALPAELGFGIALFSRIVPEQVEVLNFGQAQRPSIVVRLNLQGRRLVLIATHPRAPVGPGEFSLRNRHLDAMAEFVAQQAHPVLILGDLNVTSWSSDFRRMMRVARLRDSREGRGPQGSWPAFVPSWLGIAIDHALHTDGVRIHQRRVGPAVGSDHRPVVVEFSVER